MHSFSTISSSQWITATALVIFFACGETRSTEPQGVADPVVATTPTTAHTNSSRPTNSQPELTAELTAAELTANLTTERSQQETEQTPSTSAAPSASAAVQVLAGDFHLDPDPPTQLTRPRPKRKRAIDIELTLRSTPPGAIASVDGQHVGPTPAYWSGPKSSTAREFTFTLPGYALARYRFVPTRSGVVHGTLHRLISPVHQNDDNLTTHD